EGIARPEVPQTAALPQVGLTTKDARPSGSQPTTQTRPAAVTQKPRATQAPTAATEANSAAEQPGPPARSLDDEIFSLGRDPS
ncbi:MAG: hypothetical protein ACRC0L_12410, partial [Angustibacter sp.]